MKKYLSFLLPAALLLTLAACRPKPEPDRKVQGLVTDIQTSAEGNLTSFLVRTGDGEQVGVLFTDETRAFPPLSISGTHQEIRNAFQAALAVDTEISARCFTDRKTLSLPDGQEFPAYEAYDVDITGRLLRGEAILSDGTALDVLESAYYDPPDRTYYLSDGTQLLRVNAPIGPANVYVGGRESWDDLSETARAKILSFYEQRGLLYDEGEELERVYASWKTHGDAFSPSWMIHQDISLNASGERVVYFLTTVTLPIDHGDGCTAYDLRLGDAFDRDTGEHLDPWSLFTCPREEVLTALLDASRTRDPILRAGIGSSLTPERVILFPGSIELSFEPGSLPGQDHGYYLSVSLSDLPEGLMHPWAEPAPMDLS